MSCNYSTKTEPITARAYAALRAIVLAGTAAAAAYDKAKMQGCQDHCTPPTTPTLGEMTDMFYAYVPTTSLPLLPDQTDDCDRQGYGTFRRGAPELLAALNAATKPTVLAEVMKDMTDEQKAEMDQGGLEWWSVALSAAGILRWLGKKSFRGAIIARIAAVLLAGLVAAKAIEVVTEAGADLLKKTGGAIAAAGMRIMPIVLGGAIVLGGLYLLTRKQRKS